MIMEALHIGIGVEVAGGDYVDISKNNIENNIFIDAQELD
jgi:hypothetical protein